MKYSRTPSDLSPQEVQKRRAEFEAERKGKRLAGAIYMTPPRYDEDFYQAMEVLDLLSAHT
jgi:hypothetical protein